MYLHQIISACIHVELVQELYTVMEPGTCKVASQSYISHLYTPRTNSEYLIGSRQPGNNINIIVQHYAMAAVLFMLLKYTMETKLFIFAFTIITYNIHSVYFQPSSFIVSS